MGEIRVGDIVGRKSYGKDIYFKVCKIEDIEGSKIVSLKGLDMRLCATAPLEDLDLIEPSKVASYWRMTLAKNHEAMRHVFKRRQAEHQRSLIRSVTEPDGPGDVEGFDVPGSVLHIDGDSDYLDLCMTTYKQLKIPAEGYHISELQQAEKVYDLLVEHRPDLLVLTGHDGFAKGTKDLTEIKSYHHSTNFVNAVQAARRYEKSRDDLVIFAGACQSHYEALLSAGANFASSPQRVLIHAFDPVFVVEKVAYTSIYDPIPLREVIAGTITGFDGIGGIETRGKHRLGVPRSPY